MSNENFQDMILQKAVKMNLIKLTGGEDDYYTNRERLWKLISYALTSAQNGEININEEDVDIHTKYGVDCPSCNNTLAVCPDTQGHAYCFCCYTKLNFKGAK